MDGLSNLTSISRSLSIYYNGLTNLEGLSNLTTISGSLAIEGNHYD
ncbi:MAG: hypothetical protein R2771_00660 [Saprospiraceae bacterium]